MLRIENNQCREQKLIHYSTAMFLNLFVQKHTKLTKGYFLQNAMLPRPLAIVKLSNIGFVNGGEIVPQSFNCFQVLRPQSKMLPNQAG